MIGENDASRKVDNVVRLTMTSVDVVGESENRIAQTLVPRGKLEDWKEQWKQSMAYN